MVVSDFFKLFVCRIMFVCINRCTCINNFPSGHQIKKKLILLNLYFKVK
jgi:hypothetical protein